MLRHSLHDFYSFNAALAYQLFSSFSIETGTCEHNILNILMRHAGRSTRSKTPIQRSRLFLFVFFFFSTIDDRWISFYHLLNDILPGSLYHNELKIKRELLRLGHEISKIINILLVKHFIANHV